MALLMPSDLVSILGYLTILTGGTGFITELDMKLERATTGVLGSTRDIAVTWEHTIIIGDPFKDTVQTRSEHLRRLLR